jgi:hypothetical protein
VVAVAVLAALADTLWTLAHFVLALALLVDNMIFLVHKYTTLVVAVVV